MNIAKKIFKRDIRRITRNPIALIVMIGVCILPSLYAWFNIAANMDPYSNTGRIKVAIVNNDKTAHDESLTLNAGDSIVENLKKNNQLGWVFVNKETALEGVRSGEYYAAIIIPDTFSSSLLSILSGNLETPELDYYINEKKNAIAPKITDSGAGTLQQQINDTFASVASDSIAKILQDSVSEISGNLDSSKDSILTSIKQIQDNFKSYQDLIADFQKTVGDSSTLITQTEGSLDSAKAVAASGKQTLNAADSILSNTRTAIGSFSSAASDNIADTEKVMGDIYNNANIDLGTVEGNLQAVNTQMAAQIETLQALVNQNTALLEDLKKVSASISDPVKQEEINNLIDDLSVKNAALSALLASLTDGNGTINSSIVNLDNANDVLSAIYKSNQASLSQARSKINETIVPNLQNTVDSFSLLSGTLSTSLDNIGPSAEQLKTILEQLNSCLTSSSSILGDTGKTINDLNGKLDTIATDLKAIESSTLYKNFLSLENVDEKAISEFMSSPVEIETKELYRVDNYGTGMTPFYTNLALWVGGIVLVSILKQEVDKDEEIPSFTTVSAYMGRYFLFIMFGIVQGVIVCLGDIILLRVHCENPLLFILAGVCCSFVYVSLIYALALAFKHIGKALCVVLVILQIPGSSGTYPIEMMPNFFQRLHPLLPFSYGISAMRETIAGMYKLQYVKDLLCLSIFLGLAFLIGLVFRPLLMNLNHLYDKKVCETDFILAESGSHERLNPKSALLMKTLLNEPYYADALRQKEARFARTYKKRVKAGFAAMIVLPLIFLILMFNLESKLVFLILWIVSLVLIGGYLITIEYLNDRLQRQLHVQDIPTEKLLEMLKKGEEHL